MTTDFNTIWTEIEDNKIKSMTVSEYKNYVLAFLFYRYLSEKQERYLVDNNVIDVVPDETVNDAYSAASSCDDLNDYLEDISSSLGYAIEPHDTWASLTSKINDSTVIPSDYQTIFDNFNKNAQLNKGAARKFKGIFDDIYLGDSRLGSSTNERTKSLNKIVTVVDSIPYKDHGGNDTLGAVYEYLIEQFATSAGKKGGEFYTPHEVSTILAKIVTDDVTQSDTTFLVYDPTCGSGSTLLAMKDEVPSGNRAGAIKFYGQEKEMTTYNLARMNLLLNGISYSNVILQNADTLGNDWPDGPDARGDDHPRSFDAVVADIEFATSWDNSETRKKDPRFKEFGKLAPKKTADYAFILHCLYHLNEEGTMAMVLPNGVLFRERAEGTIRKNLIEHPSGNRIYAVIGLPENIMFSEKGKKSVAVVIVVFKKKWDSKDILFIDASNEFEKGKNKNYLTDENIKKIVETYHNRVDVDKYAHLATIDEIRENKYNLNIPRYVSNIEEEAVIDLDEVNRLLDEDDAEIAAAKAKIDAQLKILGVK